MFYILKNEKDRLGQSDPSMIKSVYQHTFSKEMDIINNKIDDFLIMLYDNFE